MKTLYVECNMGAAGDMLMAALLELHENPQKFLDKLNSIGIPNVCVSAEASVKCGIKGTHVRVSINRTEEEADHDHDHEHEKHHHEHDEHHHDHAHDDHDHTHDHGDHSHTHDHTHNHAHNDHRHNSYHDIEHLVGHLNVSDNVKKNVLAVYQLIADAESHVHGVPVEKIHFHEVGELDALADITGVCMLIEELAPDVIFASPVNVGGGQVRCAHGILPAPAPATAFILQNIPMYSGQAVGELCTPTGAALLKYFAKEFCPMPALRVCKIGYGMGKKDFEKANCVRAFLGDTPDRSEEVAELACNLDDMTGEAVSFAQKLLLEEGALDVWTTPIGMKKGRPGLQFTCLCRNEEKDKMAVLIFKHTSTLGIRENVCRRYTLHREQAELQTKFGKVRVKTACGFGVKKSKPEYEDVAKIAREQGMSLREVADAIPC